jgi:hypothetical protein
MSLTVGDLVYFYRLQAKRPQPGQRKAKLVLNQWHGPGVLLAFEGNTGIYVGYRGHVTKCAPEAVRAATWNEQLAAEDWAEVLADVLESVPPKPPQQPAEPAQAAEDQPEEQPQGSSPPSLGPAVPSLPPPLSQTAPAAGTAAAPQLGARLQPQPLIEEAPAEEERSAPPLEESDDGREMEMEPPPPPLQAQQPPLVPEPGLEQEIGRAHV